MPAYPGDINNVYFFAIGLLLDLPDPYPKPLRQLLVEDHRPELLHVVHPDGKHEVFRKIFPLEFLQNETTLIRAKAGIPALIPVQREPQFLEKLFRLLKFTSRRDKRRQREELHSIVVFVNINVFSDLKEKKQIKIVDDYLVDRASNSSR
jgi:hypothetical protein